MTAERVLVDTDIVIHLLKKHEPTIERFVSLLEESTSILLSPIVTAEVYAGAFVREYKQIETLFAMCVPIEIDTSTGQAAGLYAARYRKSHQGISLEDFLLAASARQHRCPLWTGNRKHYPMDDIELLPALGS